MWTFIGSTITLMTSIILWALYTHSILFSFQFVFTLTTLGLIVCVIVDVTQKT
jgi:hypothetical protein